MKLCWRYSLICCLLTLMLTGCATVAPKHNGLKKSWKQREQALNQLTKWQLSGKAAVKTPQESGSLAIEWTELAPNKFHLSLLGPLGSGAATLIAKPGLVSLSTSDGAHYTAVTLSQLLAKQRIVNIPVTYLTYWIRGLPAATLAYQAQFDAQNRLSVLNQQGWQVRFLSYTTVANIDLPEKIEIHSRDLQFKIIIYQWRFSD
jgi:outer membrane lipoprotein LolB